MTGKARNVPTAARFAQWLANGALRLHRHLSRVAEPEAAFAKCEAQNVLQFNANSFDAVVVQFGKTLDVESVSEQSQNMLGLSPDLLLGSGLFERIHIADRVAFMCAAAQTREEKEPSHCVLRFRLPVTPERLDCRFNSFDVEFIAPNGEDGRLVAFIRDAQEIISLRDELVQTTKKMEDLQTSTGHMLASVSHELRTPLNAILGFSDMLLHEKGANGLSAKHVEPVAMIQQAGEHLLSLVNTILDVSKLEAGAYEICSDAVDLKSVVNTSREMLKPLAQQKEITVSVQTGSDFGCVQGDKRALLQIFVNLLSNAIKFTPAGGNVHIRAQAHYDIVRVYIDDTGIGIAAHDMERLGQPFMQVQNCYTRDYAGAGLGLSLVKGLLKLHEGDMDIESTPGIGTTVTISLPLVHSTQETDRHNKADEGEAGEGHGIALRKAG